jgi:rRNA maturation RNase YbeY
VDDAPTLDVEVVAAHAALDLGALRALVRHVIDAEGATLRYLGLVLADRATVLDLNRRYLGHDYATDVLSFPLDAAEGVVDGEVYVDLDTAAQRHGEFGATFEEEVRRYVVHGVLHLVGYNDATAPERAAMRALEDRYLRTAPNA